MTSDPHDSAPLPVSVRIFGSLRPFRTEKGLSCELSVEVPEEGVAASELALKLGLPLDWVEGVFVNHTVHAVSARVSPGDRIAFVPRGTPGPHRVFLGLYAAGCECGSDADADADTAPAGPSGVSRG